jgi:peptide/nickel transport system substrate-binding protein
MPAFRIAAAAALAWVLLAGSALAEFGIAMHGDPTLSRRQALPYANPSAPQGGRITLGILGTFDNLNPMIPRGTLAPGMRDLLYGNLVYESLLDRNFAEPFSLYSFLASDVFVPEDRSSVTFTIGELARFSDGTPVTARDVVFSFELQREKGRPNQRTYYSKVEAVETPDERTVTFRFPNANDRELPLILGLMPILSAAATDPERFGETTLSPPIGSGPYVVAEVDPGRSVLYRKNSDYWGRDLPINRGRYNADEIRFRFYRNETAMFEAFKTGEIDLFLETEPRRWATAYDFPAVREGRVVLDEIPVATPRGMFAFVFNTRRAIFADVRVREALNLLFDFEWMNQNLFLGRVKRTRSYFEGSELASTGLQLSETERNLLAPYLNVLLAPVLAGTWTPPVSDGSGRDRTAIMAALALLNQAGWRVDGGRLVDANGRQFSFEILVTTDDDERLALALQRFMRPVGIDARIRAVDPSQYYARMIDFDFDMARVYWPSSLSPGNEQLHRWSIGAADTPGSLNYAGAKEPAIDAMIATMLAATDREAFVDSVRALDRVLLSGRYVIPLYHTPAQWVGRATRIGRPQQQSLSGAELETWWVEDGGD